MKSLWNESNNLEFNKINSNYQCDVCIIGGGISGISTGYYLSKEGLKVMVVEKNTIGSKTTGKTTAKITYQHNLIYNYLIESYGYNFAKAYLNANKEAILNIKNIIDLENIDCDFEYTDNIIYTCKQENLVKIHKEVKALQELSENAEFVTNTDLPFEIVGGVKIKNQAQFNPIKYIYGLSSVIIKNGGKIFTDSIAVGITKLKDGYETVVNDYKIKSKYVVLASHYPFKNFPGFHFLKMYQSTSYVLAIDPHEKVDDRMYINIEKPVYSLKTALINKKRILLVGGGDHKTGYSLDRKKTYGYLEEFIKKYYPKAEVLYKWSTRDCITLDKIPYIGKYSTMYPNVFIETGYNKWGMTSSNVAANIVKDMIIGKENKYSFVFNSLRLKPIKNRKEFNNMFKQVFKSYIVNRIKIPEEDISKIKKNNGAIIKVKGNVVGIYKDNNGVVYAVKPTCTHLGCLLTWNNIDKTWDCPCHGSRFNYDGKNLYDPAFKDLERYQ